MENKCEPGVKNILCKFLNFIIFDCLFFLSPVRSPESQGDRPRRLSENKHGNTVITVLRLCLNLEKYAPGDPEHFLFFRIKVASIKCLQPPTKQNNINKKF